MQIVFIKDDTKMLDESACHSIQGRWGGARFTALLVFNEKGHNKLQPFKTDRGNLQLYLYCAFCTRSYSALGL